MNNILKSTVVGAILASAAFAQPSSGELTGRTPPDPATMIQHKVERLTSLLTLTTAQAAQATTIFTAAQTAVTPLQTSISGYRTSLQAAVKSNSTAIIDQLSASIGSATGQMLAIQNKADAAFYATLTSAQQTTLAAAGGGFGGGRGGPGGPGGFGRGPAPQ